MQTWRCSGDESGMNLLESWSQPREGGFYLGINCTNPKRNHRKVMCHYFDRVLLFYLFGD